MKYLYKKDTTPYCGDELSSHWIYRTVGILGDAVVAFSGPCNVDISRMVDLEDVLNEDYIYSENMLHFIVEIFGIPLEEGVLIQRLFSSILQDRINAECGQLAVRRIGDDLFYNDTKKLFHFLLHQLLKSSVFSYFQSWDINTIKSKFSFHNYHHCCIPKYYRYQTCNCSSFHLINRNK